MSRELAIVGRFIGAINAHDLDGIEEWLAEDHRFVDSAGATVAGRAAVRAAWARFLERCPDYQIDVADHAAEGRVVGLFGWAAGSGRVAAQAAGSGRVAADAGDRAFRVPAAWKALVVDGRVAEWRVYCDPAPLRRALGDEG